MQKADIFYGERISFNGYETFIVLKYSNIAILFN